MRLVHCTNKLIDHLNVSIQDKEINHSNQRLGDWYSNIFIFERRKCLIFVNIKTLCAFVVPDLLKQDLLNFHDYFIKGLTNLLESINVNPNVQNEIISEYLNIQIVKTESKSILGSINDYIQLYKWTLGEKEEKRKWTSVNYNIQVNKRPNKKLKFRTPFEELDDLITTEYLKNH